MSARIVHWPEIVGKQISIKYFPHNQKKVLFDPKKRYSPAIIPTLDGLIRMDLLIADNSWNTEEKLDCLSDAIELCGDAKRIVRRIQGLEYHVVQKILNRYESLMLNLEKKHRSLTHKHCALKKRGYATLH